MRQTSKPKDGEITLAWCVSCLTWVDASLTLTCDHVWADHERVLKARARRWGQER